MKYLSVFLRFIIVTFVLTVSSNTAHSNNAIGQAYIVKGNAYISHLGSVVKESINVETPIYMGDRIETDLKSLIDIKFIDQTSIRIGENGSFVIDEYVYDPGQENNGSAEFTLLNAAFMYISGKLTKTNNPNVSINLDFGSIGIRGTKILRAMRKMECWIYIEEGIARVSNDAGYVTLDKGQGTRMSSRSISPTLPWDNEDFSWIEDELK